MTSPTMGASSGTLPLVVRPARTLPCRGTKTRHFPDHSRTVRALDRRLCDLLMPCGVGETESPHFPDQARHLRGTGPPSV
jgi:hypothetical protein